MSDIRYILFAGLDYYPQGGAEDFVLKYSDLSDTLKFGIEILGRNNDWAHVFDLDTMSIIWAAQVCYHPGAPSGIRNHELYELSDEDIEDKNAEIRGAK